jgi:hypothetical protein
MSVEKLPNKNGYTRYYEKALQDLKNGVEPSYSLMIDKPYPSTLGYVVNVDNFQIDSTAYIAFDRYVRECYEVLFPSEFVKGFENHPQMGYVVEMSKSGLLHALNLKLAIGKDLPSEFSLLQKRRFELDSRGKRADFPRHFTVNTLEKLQEGTDPICQNFVKYMGMLSLAAYQRIFDYSSQHRLKKIDLESFYKDNFLAPYDNPAAIALRQAFRNYLNFSSLLSVILHVQSHTQGLNVALRQYFIDKDGKEMVAKCGFLNAFQSHVVDIVLADGD